MSELKPYVVAMVFGSPPNTVPAIVVNLAPNEISAAVMAVSKAYLDGQTETIVGFNVAQLTEEFITAAHRGTAEPAPVLSIVPQVDVPVCARCGEHPWNTPCPKPISDGAA